MALNRPTAESLWESRKAGRMLRLLDLREPIAVAAETNQSELQRQAFANHYRSLFGIAPEQRHELRTELERIRQGSDQTVENIIALLQRSSHSSGFAGS